MVRYHFAVYAMSDHMPEQCTEIWGKTGAKYRNSFNLLTVRVH